VRPKIPFSLASETRPSAFVAFVQSPSNEAVHQQMSCLKYPFAAEAVEVRAAVLGSRAHVLVAGNFIPRHMVERSANEDDYHRHRRSREARP